MNATVEIWYKLEKKVWKYSKDSQLLIHECMKRRKLEIRQRKTEIKQEAIDVYFDKVNLDENEYLQKRALKIKDQP